MKKRSLSLALALAMTVSLFSGCSSKGNTNSTASGNTGAATTTESVTINVALANNPISQALAKITKDNYKADGVTVNVSVLPENDLRQKQTTEASTGGTTYDMYYIGPYEASYWSKNGWLEDLEPYFQKMDKAKLDAYDRDDLFKGMQDSLKYNGDAYALPFYGEGAFTMYNKDLFKEAGIEMPDTPTWDQIYTFATKINNKSKGITGITLRGQAGWGMSGCPIITMANAFGAQWYDTNWNATVDTKEMRAAWTMYKKLLVDAGQADIVNYTYNECQALMQSGKCGIYYDATSLAPGLESNESKIKGHVGYAMAPHQVKESNCGWLWSWDMGINPKTTDAKKQAVFDYMIWATSKDFAKLAQQSDPTGASTPCAARTSTYSLEGYKDLPYASETMKALADADFTKPCVNKTPYVGLQYIAIPEFADLGDKMTQNVAAYVTGKMTLDEAISKTQEEFNEAAKDGGYQS